jgi:hypothetical protein
MPYLPSPTFNPTVSAVPILDSSSGDPKAAKDPKSVASIGKNIQAMQDQASADRLFDAPLKEGFSNLASTNVSPSGFGNPENFFKTSDFRYPDGFDKLQSPQIVNSQACKRIQGFSDMNGRLSPLVATLVALGAVLVLSSFL